MTTNDDDDALFASINTMASASRAARSEDLTQDERALAAELGNAAADRAKKNR
ncbi:hypothetical protein [Streptomyces sp. NPDC051569]|uniref:hypothetical protein n=1 Tax=Streptomyces sp. NPDC051569 TaxID=3365661 RepID=UPI0037B137E3